MTTVQKTSDGKRIGFIDYDLNNFHADVFLEAIRGPLALRGFEVAGATALQQDPSAKWADTNNVRYFESVDALDETVDVYMILAPSHPEVHLELCNRVFPKGKVTYVDKPFAPDLMTAKRIFKLADHHGVQVQTSSALRYTRVQQIVAQSDQPIRNMVVWAGGTTFEEYGIHPIELVVSCMGSGALSVMSVGDERHPQITIRFTHGRVAMVDFNIGTHVQYEAAITTAKETVFVTVDTDTLFVDTAAAILDFFEADRPMVDHKQSLAVRAILDGIANPQARSRFVHLDKTAASELPGPVAV